MSDYSEKSNYPPWGLIREGAYFAKLLLPEENPFVAILGDIAEATPTEMLIDEDEEGDEEIDVLFDVLFKLEALNYGVY